MKELIYYRQFNVIIKVFFFELRLTSKFHVFHVAPLILYIPLNEITIFLLLHGLLHLVALVTPNYP